MGTIETPRSGRTRTFAVYLRERDVFVDCGPHCLRSDEHGCSSFGALIRLGRLSFLEQEVKGSGVTYSVRTREKRVLLLCEEYSSCEVVCWVRVSHKSARSYALSDVGPHS